MKDNEFIELLNLYLDHEISEADAGRLEAEVQRSAARYRVYREYCQMHKAVALLSPSPATEAPAVATFETTRSKTWANPFAVGGLMAAAAAVAFIVLSRPASTNLPGVDSGAVTAQTSTPASTSEEMPSGSTPRSIGQTVTVPVSLGRADRPVVTTLRWGGEEANAATAVTPDARFNWIETLQLTSVSGVPADSLRFETKPVSKEPQRSFGSGSLEAPTEYNAIQFQR